jgi:serine/threonine protein phosphatase PrpC
MTNLPPRWKVIGASVPGTSHIASGVVCQDAWECRILPGGALVAAVADGAGSARYADEASRVAVDTAADALAAACGCARPTTEEACRTVLEDCLIGVRAQLERRAAARVEQQGEAASVKDFSTTLLAILVTDELFGCLQVGDGAIVSRETATGVLTVAFAPDHGEYINETCFVTSRGVERRAHYRVTPSRALDAVALLTDGLEMLAILHRDNTAHAAFFAPLFSFARGENAAAEDLEQFLASDRVCERSDDDKTLVLAVRIP